MKTHSTRRLVILAALVAASGASCRHTNSTAEPSRFAGATPLEWSVRMADSEIGRRGDSLMWKESGKAKWDYTAGLFTLSLLKLNEQAPDPSYVEFSAKAIGSFIAPDGTIRQYKREDFNIDNINPGKTVLALSRLTEDERYRKAAANLRDQLKDHPRTSDGGFWHKLRYPSQMWLDGLYMGEPFYAEYAMRFGPADDFSDVVKQFRLMDRHGYDPHTGLYYHAWDEANKQTWANPTSGTSSNFWGRGMGWFAMALVDVLDFIPAKDPGREEIIAILQKTCQGIVRYQDPDTGLWWQVLDQGGRKGNYLEATASSMFVYSLAKGLNRGYLPQSFRPAATKGYAGLIERLIRRDPGGGISLTSCCMVAGLGNGRDGSYAYYLSEPVVDNDLKGVGPFILSGIEMQRLLGLPPAKLD